MSPESSSYSPPFLLSNPHLQTMYPTLFRRVQDVNYSRERLVTDDHDFLDLDWSRTEASERLALVAHGMEGSSRSHYVRGMVRRLNRSGWDALAWNCRGCSGEPNLQRRFYHSGASDDLARIVNHILATTAYQEIALIGFSMGGNISLKYLGEQGTELSPRVKRAATFSVPCDLASSAHALSAPSNTVYMKRFLYYLRPKIREKAARFPGEFDISPLDRIRTFEEFDELYTAPLHGFPNAATYWERCSSKSFLRSIKIPTLIVNALDDPFLRPPSFPRDEAQKNPNVLLETPARGGHVGFVTFSESGAYWSDDRALKFLDTGR